MSFLSILLLTIGLLMVTSGVSHWSPPAAVIILGLALMAAGWDLAR